MKRHEPSKKLELPGSYRYRHRSSLARGHSVTTQSKHPSESNDIQLQNICRHLTDISRNQSVQDNPAILDPHRFHIHQPYTAANQDQNILYPSAKDSYHQTFFHSHILPLA
jgi:hypothetical protein